MILSVVFPVLASGAPFPIYSGGTYGVYLSQPSLPLPHGAVIHVESKMTALELGSTAMEHRFCLWLYAKSQPQLTGMQSYALNRLRDLYIGSPSGLYIVEDDVAIQTLHLEDAEVWSSSVYFTIKGVT